MTASTARPSPDQQHELLARLGLDDRATSEDVAETHDELVAFLTTAPRSLRAWARTQAAAADEAFALLTDPDAPGVPRALSGSTGRPTVLPDGPATPPARRAPSPAATAAVVATADVDLEEELDEPLEAEDDDVTFEQLLAEVTPGTHRESIETSAPKRKKRSAKTPTAAGAAAVAATTSSNGIGWRRVALVGVVVAAIGIAAVGIFQLGAASNSPGSIASGSQQPQASPDLDQALVSDLMAKVQADPTDTVSMMALGDAFYGAQDFASAATWFQKALDVDPTDSRAQLALGAAWFNAGDLDQAEEAWLAVIARDPDDEDALLEANYDLGFLYLNQEPPDMEGVQRHWGEVVRLAPDSDVAQTVKAHLDALASEAPSAAPSAEPSGSVEP